MKKTAKKEKSKKGMTKICLCGNQGYTALKNDIHLEGCPNYVPLAYTVSLQLDKTTLEGKGATVLEALRAIEKPVKITTKSILTVSRGDKKHSRGLTIPLAKRLFFPGFQMLQAHRLELLLK